MKTEDRNKLFYYPDPAAKAVEAEIPAVIGLANEVVMDKMIADMKRHIGCSCGQCNAAAMDDISWLLAPHNSSLAYKNTVLNRLRKKQ